MEKVFGAHHKASACDVLDQLGFGFVGHYPLAGMGEPWTARIEQTHKALKKVGIGAILTVMEDDLYGRRHMSSGFRHIHIPVDDCMPPDKAQMDCALAFIDTNVNQNVGVAVHCAEGRGRTGTVLCAWLGKTESLAAPKAIKRIRMLRPYTVLTSKQKEFLTTYLASQESHKKFDESIY